jgi:CRP/FNR family transcriptional regulator
LTGADGQLGSSPRVNERVAAFLVGLRTRYESNGLTSKTLELPMTRQDIADHLGMTIETVSRTLTRFARERLLLIVPGGVRPLATDRLDELAGQQTQTLMQV